MMNNKFANINYYRVFVSFTLFLFSFIFFLFPVSAATDAETTMNTYYDSIMSWYRIIRDNIAIPLLILSFAYSGFRILFSGFLGKSDTAYNDGIKKFWFSVFALMLLFLLPFIIQMGKSLFANTGWKPEGATFPETTSFTKFFSGGEIL